MRPLLLLAVGCAAPASRPTAPPPAPAPAPAALGLRLAPGFAVAQVSDEALASDLYAMAVSPRGEIAVSSKGWVKLLRDRDGDGKADEAITVVETATGSMGLRSMATTSTRRRTARSSACRCGPTAARRDRRSPCCAPASPSTAGTPSAAAPTAGCTSWRATTAV